MQRLTYIVNWPLHTIVNSYKHQAYSMRSHNNVNKQDLVHLRPVHDRWPRKVFLKLLEGQCTLLGPLKYLPLIQQLEEGSASVC